MTAATKQQFRAVLEREFAKHPWWDDAERHARAMAAIERLSGA